MAYENLYGTNCFDTLTFTNAARAYDGDLDLYASYIGNPDGNFNVPNFTEVPAWDVPVHQAEYTALDLIWVVTTANFNANGEWALRYSINGGAGWVVNRALSSDNVTLQTYTQAISDPTTQTINDIVGQFYAEIVAGPPPTVTVWLYEIFLRGTYPDAGGGGNEGEMMLMGVEHL